MPCHDPARVQIDLYDAIEEIPFDLGASPPQIAVTPAGVSVIIDAGQFDGRLSHHLARHRRLAPERDAKARELAGRGYRCACAQSGEVKLIDDAHVRIGDEVDHEVATIGE